MRPPSSLLPCLFALGLLAPQPAPAQAEGARRLEEIVVTAQKTEQSIEDVPVSVSTLDGELLSQTGATDFTDLQGYAGNVVLKLSPDGGKFTIRGFGTPASNPGFEPSVATVMDGVFYGRSTFLNAFFYDIDRVELLRGPQGTLFGKNATAGLLNLISRAPGTEAGAEVDLFYNDDHTTILRPVLQLPLGSDFSLRLSGSFVDDDGKLYNTALDRHEAGQRQDSLRLRARYAPAARWSLDLSAFHSDIRANNNDFQLSQVSDAMLATIQQYDPDAEASASNFRNSANVPARVENRLDGVSASFNHELDGLLDVDRLALTTVFGWARSRIGERDIDADFSPLPVIRNSLVDPSTYAQRSYEIRLNGHEDAPFGWGHGIDFVLGGYYFGSTLRANDLFKLEDLGAALAYVSAAQLGLAGPQALRLAQLIGALEPLLAPVIGEEQSAFTSLDQQANAGALFGQFEYFVSPRWALIGGLRISREFKEGDFASQAQGLFVPLIADQEDHRSHIERSETDLSPKAGVRWAYDDDTSAYFSWSRAYKSGGFNALPLNPDNLDYDRERASSWELGARSRFADGSMRASVTLFHTRFENLQVSTFQGGSFVILNAAAARSRGFEADLQWLLPLPGFALNSSVGYADARYTRYTDAPAPADAENPTQDLSGRRLANAPRWTSALVPSYTDYWPRLNATATLALDYFYRSGRYLDVDLDPRTYQSSTQELNARISLGAQSGEWLVNLAARNLTGERVLEQVLDQPLAPGNFAAIRGDRGREYSASVILSFP